MEKKIYIREIISKPPTKEQRALFFREMFELLETRNVLTQNKTAEEIEENLYVLREKGVSTAK